MIYTACNLCKGEVEETAEYCTHCGAVFDTSFMCADHPYIPAMAVCVECHKPLCHRDILYYHGKAYCYDHLPGRLNGEGKPYSALWKGCFKPVEMEKNLSSLILRLIYNFSSRLGSAPVRILLEG